jgi:hypothetical protein
MATLGAFSAAPLRSRRNASETPGLRGLIAKARWHAPPVGYRGAPAIRLDVSQAAHRLRDTAERAAPIGAPANTYGLQGKGDLSEMGDAVLGVVSQQLGAKAPSYAIVRNVSDPEINSRTLSLRQQAKLAADIYKGYGRWSSVCSAIVCWAIVAAL